MDVAADSLRRAMSGMAAVAVLFAIVFTVVALRHPEQWRLTAGAAMVFILYPAIQSLIQRGRLQKLRSIQQRLPGLATTQAGLEPLFSVKIRHATEISRPPTWSVRLPGKKQVSFHLKVAGAPQAPTASVASALNNLSAGSSGAGEFQWIQLLPRPRKVRLTWRGRFYYFVLGPIFLYLGSLVIFIFWKAFAETHSLRPVPTVDWVAAIAGIGYGWVCVRFLRKWPRERRLFALGECAIGKVLSQDAFRGRFYQNNSTITYDFADNEGRIFKRQVRDYSGTRFEGMPVAVFYDSANPANNIALGCSLQEVVPNVT